MIHLTARHWRTITIRYTLYIKRMQPIQRLVCLHFGSSLQRIQWTAPIGTLIVYRPVAKNARRETQENPHGEAPHGFKKEKQRVFV